MRRKTVKLVAVALPAALVVGAIARPTSAKDSAYTFYMTLRAVNGDKNKIYHDLPEGELTVTGEIWVTEKAAKSTPTPSNVKIEVIKKGSWTGSSCSFEVVPATTLFRRLAYSHTCGHLAAGTYYILVSKPAVDNSGDHWTEQGSGKLTVL